VYNFVDNSTYVGKYVDNYQDNM